MKTLWSFNICNILLAYAQDMMGKGGEYAHLST